MTARGFETVEALKARLELLQEPLGRLITKADVLFEAVLPFAPHPADVEVDFPVTAVSSINAEPSHELTIKLTKESSVSIHKYPLSATPVYPLKRVWFWRPEPELELVKRRVEALELAGSRAAEGLPYDIETSTWNTGNNTIRDFIGFGYVDQEESIDETDQALDEAKAVAVWALGLHVQKK